MSAQEPRIKISPEALLLAIAVFLAPVLGGHVSTDARPLFEGLLGEILGGGALPLTARLLLAFFPLAALGLALKNRVIQIPNIKLLALLTGLLLVLAGTVAITEFRSPAFREWQTWLIYASSFLAAIAIGGRNKNIRLFLASMGAGTAVVALKGIGEYASMMAKEPTYRIFADWNNPNAVASMFVLGTLVLLGLGAAEQGGNRWLAFVGSALTTLALVLTQSKGGYLAFAVGFVAFIAFQLAFRQGKRIAVPALSIIVGVALAFGLAQVAQAQSQGGQALARIAESGSTVEQSQGFRTNLWKSALTLSQQHPMGTGVGTFRFYSAKPGLTDQTVFAHQTFLQTLAEGGILALALLAGFAVFWFYLVLRGSRVQPDATLSLKAGVLAAIVGFGAHGFVESNLSFFGTGLCFFILLGLGLQLSTDGSSPEAMPGNVRGTVAVVLCAIPFLLAAVAAMGEVQKATFRTAMENRDAQLIAELADSLPSSTFNDPESLYLASFSPEYASDTEQTKAERLELLDRAVQGMPTPMFLRAAARQAIAAGESEQAIAYLDRVNDFDPSNLPAGELRIEILDELGRTEQAKQAAQDLVAMEQSVAYQVRAIPEVIPTPTFDARIYLASQTNDPAERARLLQEAVDGYVRYKEVTYAKLQGIKKQIQDANPGVTVEDEQAIFATENLAEAKQKLGKALEAANRLANLYDDLNETEKAAQARQAAEDLSP